MATMKDYKDNRTTLQKIFWRKHSKRFHQIDNEDNKINTMMEKLGEEVLEVAEGLQKNDIANVIEECFDVIQVILGILWKVGVQDKRMFRKFLKLHNDKLASRGWKFKKGL